MKRILTFIATCIAALVFSQVSSAQDIIHTYDTSPIKANIMVIDDDYLHYKTWDNQDGPLYSISLSKVEKIVFRNGTIRIIPRTNQQTVPGSDGRYPNDYRHGEFYKRQGRVSSQEIYDYIGYSLYGHEYMKARNQYTWGMSLTCIGVGGLLITLASHVASNRMNELTALHHGTAGNRSNAGTIAGYAVSAGCIGVGIPLWAKGSKGLNKIADDYSRQHTSLSLGSTQNGLGLALKF